MAGPRGTGAPILEIIGPSPSTAVYRTRNRARARARHVWYDRRNARTCPRDVYRREGPISSPAKGRANVTTYSPVFGSRRAPRLRANAENVGVHYLRDYTHSRRSYVGKSCREMTRRFITFPHSRVSECALRAQAEFSFPPVSNTSARARARVVFMHRSCPHLHLYASVKRARMLTAATTFARTCQVAYRCVPFAVLALKAKSAP